MTRLIVFLVLWLGCCAFALARGGAPERIGAAILLAAAVLSALTQSPHAAHFHQVEVGVLLVDIGVLAGFACLALTADRFWPLWMSAMQAIVVFSHLGMEIDPAAVPWGYWNAETLWAYPMLLVLAGATWRHRQRLRDGPAPSWKRFSRR